MMRHQQQIRSFVTPQTNLQIQMNLPDIQRRMIHQIISTLYGDFRAAKERKKERSRKEFRTHKLKKAGGYTVCSEGKYELPRASR